jgi:DNA polymerase I-like protein with 3'-5' exonuclease and polymerase domains
MTTDERFLAYLHTPYEEPASIRFFISDGVAHAEEVGLDAIHHEPLVSYELPTLVPHFRQAGVAPPAALVDLIEAARLLRGRPATAQVVDPSGIWALLRRETQHARAALQLQSIIFREGGRTSLSTSELLILMADVLRGLRELWQRIRHQLDASGELSRFTQVEQPTAALLLQTQYRGLRFDRAEVNRRLGQLGETIARSAAALRLNWNVRRPTDSAQLVAALGHDNRLREDEVLRRPTLARVIRARLDAALDLLPDGHALVAEIKRFRASTHDKAILLHLSSRATERVYPPFTVLGTVTGRPLARTPALQYLSRATRAVLRADEGKTLLYPDFCQFEPGILAEDSGDAKLQQDFNTGDLYTALSQKVFGTSDRRDQAKLIFLAFCYGMSVQRAAELISEPGITTDIESMIATFFEEYSGLEPWRRQIHTELLREGRIGSRFGNFRYRSRRDRPLDAPERRWSLSQRVQGTASLILKRAMLKVAAAGCAELLLPMHDAALYQVEATRVDEARRVVERCFSEAFTEECPHLQPRIQFASFAASATPLPEEPKGG